MPHLNIEVFECHGISAEQLHGVTGHKANSEETLHLVGARPLGHLTAREREEKRRVDTRYMNYSNFK